MRCLVLPVSPSTSSVTSTTFTQTASPTEAQSSTFSTRNFASCDRCTSPLPLYSDSCTKSP